MNYANWKSGLIRWLHSLKNKQNWIAALEKVLVQNGLEINNCWKLTIVGNLIQREKLLKIALNNYLISQPQFSFLPNITKLTHINSSNFHNFWKDIYKTKGVVYVMCNCTTKKLIVGSISSNVFTRFKSHIKERVDRLQYKAAMYVRNLDIHSWIIFPVAVSKNENSRKIMEGWWARQLKSYIINNLIELITHEIT